MSESSWRLNGRLAMWLAENLGNEKALAATRANRKELEHEHGR